MNKNLFKYSILFVNSTSWLFFLSSFIYIKYFCESCDADSLLGFVLIEPFVLVVTISINVIAFVIYKRNKIDLNQSEIFLMQLPVSTFIAFFYFSFFASEIIKYMNFSDTGINFYLANVFIITVLEVIIYFIISMIYRKYIQKQ
jgi:hypothetical protein